MMTTQFIIAMGMWEVMNANVMRTNKRIDSAESLNSLENELENLSIFPRKVTENLRLKNQIRKSTSKLEFRGLICDLVKRQ
jgi:hypothetical protein